MLNIAIVGTGKWGINHVRNFSELDDANLYICCDRDVTQLQKIKKAYPQTKITQRFEDVISDRDIDAVVIATSAVSHFPLAKQALIAGKHVFVEKPMTLNTEDAEELVQLSESLKSILMVGHLMVYHPAVETLKELISTGKLGDIYYLYSQRVNLGQIRTDENALWSLAPHDISILLYLLEEEPLDVSVRGESYLQDGIHDVAFVNLRFPNKRTANIQLSWLDPHKIRKLTIVGSKKMVVFDDVESTEKVRIYDKGVIQSNDVTVPYRDAMTLRFGDITIPNIRITEPLKIECQHFLDCINHNQKPRSNAYDGLQVVRVLEAAQKSLNKGGVPVNIDYATENL